MMFFRGLIWTLFQVCWALEGPWRVTAPLGGSVSVLCQYGKGKEEFVKFWCKEATFRFCSSNHTIYTTGSEAEVKWNAITIKDNHASRLFRVTMDNLTQGDTGTYLCGVQRTRYDIWHPVDVIITPDVAASADFPNSVLETVTEEEPSFSTIAPERIQPNNIHFLLLLSKILIFLALMAVVVWVHICYKEGRSCSAKDSRDARRALRTISSLNTEKTEA
uniref:CMRF35-like molecule 5 n=1 Tax=Euleptes europaea TaxID=460621 RepID=UPI0025415C14|nr:CMRF35-like molecule 5 [Euleptes europaea]